MVEFGSIRELTVAFTSIYVFITACRCSDIRISVGLSHNVSHPGDNVTLTCRVQGAQKEIAVVWEKLPVTGTDVGREIIGRDDQLSDDYRKLTKYDIFVIELPHVVISILTINHVGVEESGLIGCSVSVEDAIYRDATLFQVFKQPSDIWCSCEQCTNDFKISAIEGDNLEVQCIARRVQPLPHISAHLGHKSLTGHHTVTNWTTNVHCGQKRISASEERSADAKHCPVHFDYDVQFRLTNHRVSYLDDGRELTIAVGLGHSGWPAMVKRLPVKARYAPKFNCSNPTDAEFRSRNLVIVCRLLSKPALSSNTPFVWWRHLHQGNRTIHVGQSIDGYELREKGKSYDAGERPSVESVVHGKGGAFAYTLELVIHETQAQDFQTSFHFYAQNEIGSTTETIHLRQTATTPKSQPATQSSGRPHGCHTKKPSSQAQLINEATIWTIHPITSMTFCFITCFL